jgi:hypothetical protein
MSKSVRGMNILSVLAALCAYALCIYASIQISVLTYGHLWIAGNQFSASGLLTIVLFVFSSLVSGIVAAGFAGDNKLIMAATTGFLIGVIPAVINEFMPIFLIGSAKPLHLITVMLLLNSLGPFIGANIYLKVTRWHGVHRTEQMR